MSGWMLWRLKSDFFLKAAPSMGFFGAQGAPGLFCYLFYLLLNFFFSLRRGAGLSYLSSLRILNFYLSPSTRSGRAGPLLSAPAESRQRQAQGSFTPLRIPGPKWGAGRPPLETPKSRCAIRIGRTPRRFAAGASVPLGKAASACALASAAAPPPLRGGGCAPLPPKVPRWETSDEKFADHARQRMVPRPKRLLQATPPQICAEAPAAKRLGVPSLPSRGCGRRPL